MFADAFNYFVYDNPISKGVVQVTKSTIGLVTKSNSEVPTIKIITERVPLYEQMSRQGPFLKIAGIMGATAVALGAYGAHKKYPSDKIDDLKPVYETANRFHFFHTLALFGVPFSKYPVASGTLFIVGTTLFTGACYYRAFTGEDKFRRLAPVGGTILMLAWVSLVL